MAAGYNRYEGHLKRAYFAGAKHSANKWRAGNNRSNGNTTVSPGNRSLIVSFRSGHDNLSNMTEACPVVPALPLPMLSVPFTSVTYWRTTINAHLHYSISRTWRP